MTLAMASVAGTSCRTVRRRQRLLSVPLKLILPWSLTGSIHGVSWGAGGVMVINDSHDILDIVENTLNFLPMKVAANARRAERGTIQLLRLIRKNQKRRRTYV